MRKTISVTMLLALLVGLLGTVPVASQGPDQPFKATPLEVESSFDADKPEGSNALVGVMVKLKDAPLARYAGDVPGLAATAPTITGAEKLEVESAESQAYLNYLAAQQDSFVAAVKAKIPQAQVTHRYDIIFGGVSMVLPQGQLDVLSTLPGVEAVYADELLQPVTDRSPWFIGAPRVWRLLGGQDEAGEGVVVGVLDTGIWPEHPSFSDPDPAGDPYPDPPNTWTGTDCDFGNTAWNPNDLPFDCNNKLIGAATFLDTYKAYVGLIPYDPGTGLGEFDSARDDDGHGTHTTSTAAGNYDVEVTLLGVPRGEISGVAPRAHVAMYRVCAAQGCYSSDSAAAVQQAIADGVNMINFSISGGVSPYSDAVELAFLDAYAAGVFVAASAGNSGPTPNTVNHRGPWVTTVGASTTDRHFLTTVTLVADNGDRLEVVGASLTQGISEPTAVVFSPDPLCYPQPPGTFNGEIVICDRGIFARVTKSYNVMNAGGGGVLLRNMVPNQGLSTDNYYIPGAHLEYDQGQLLDDFMNTHTGVTATFPDGTATTVQGDVMASFSSRGGPGQTLGISKPDVTAPGVQILAGNTPLGAFQGPGGMGPLGEFFQCIQGTSMSSPHVVGAAALIKHYRPWWTPGQIKSALMTTARTRVYKEDGVTLADPFDMGSGRIDLNKIGPPNPISPELFNAGPGVTFDVTAEDYLAHQNDLWNVNYPSIYVPVMPGQITVVRTAKSVIVEPNEIANRKWAFKVIAPSDVKISVPDSILIPDGGSTSFEITIDARNVPLGEVRHATIYMIYKNYQAHLPVTIMRGQPAVTLEKTCDPGTLQLGAQTDCTITIENTGYENAAVVLTDRLPSQLELVSGSVVGAEEYGNGVIFEGVLQGTALPTIEIVDATGGTPGGYLPLSGFGVAPIGGVGDETLINFSVDPFVYAGVSYTSIGMVSNGYAVVGGGTVDDISYINQTLPDPARPNNVLATFWTDLNPAAGGGLRAAYLTNGIDDWLVLDWEDVPNYDDGELNSFQMWIGVNGVHDISYTYGSVSDGNNGLLTVGAENDTGTSGDNWYVNGSGTPVGAGDELRVIATPGGTGETHIITFSATGVAVGAWQNCAEMTSDVFQGINIACFSGEVIQ